MGKSLILVLLTMFLVSSFAAQSFIKVSLIIKNCEETESICDTQHLVKYNFLDGNFVGKESILTVKTLDLRFDLGENRIYQNRYIITNWGDIIDLKSNSILHKSEGELIEINGDDVIIKVDRVDKEGIFKFNLKTRKYTKLNSPNIYEVEGAVSPDKAKFAYYIFLQGLVIEQFENKKKTKVKGSFGVELDEVANEFGKLPIFWIDNDRFLTQRSNGDIVIVNTQGKLTPLLRIPVKNSPYISPVFYRNVRGQIIYDIGQEYLIDLDRKNYKLLELEDFGEFIVKTGLSEPTYPSNHQNEYYYLDKQIGSYWTSDININKNFIAVAYSCDGKPESLGSPKGISVWNNLKNDWISFEIKWSPEIMGWIEE